MGRFVAFMRDEARSRRPALSCVRRSFAKARSVAMKRASIGGMSFTGSTASLPVPCGERLGINDEVARCTAAGSSIVSFTGLSSSIALSFSLDIGLLSRR